MSQQILSQDEVDALLQGITGESQSIETEEEQAADSNVRAYDLSSQERLVRGRMPALEIVNERFARDLRIGLFNLIRRNPEISIAGNKVQKYSAFLRDIVVPNNFNIVAIKPLRGSGLVVCDPALIFAAIDALFGGSGKFHTRIEGRDFSPIELEYQRSEMQPQFANIATPSEMVLSSSFRLELGDVTGSIHVCIPYATFEPIRDLLYSSTQGDGGEPDRRWVNLLRSQIQDASVEMVAELGTAPATVEQLLAFKPGDFIELDIDPLIQAKVNGVPVFDCQYGMNNGRYAIRIEKLLTGASAGWLGDANHGR
jgi:flagellar motor switch protein FliM